MRLSIGNEALRRLSPRLEGARCLFRRRVAIIDEHQIAIVVVVVKECFE